MNRKILILTGPYGEGHKQAALALLETCKLTRPNVEAVMVDFMEWTLPRLYGLSKTVFHQGVQKFPSVYGYLFRRTRRRNTLTMTTGRLRWYGLKRVVKLLEEVRPTVVVSTFPLSSSAMSMLKMTGLTEIPTVTVITDHTDHSYWVHPGTDRYIVGSDKVKDGLVAMGVADYRITVTGIPVRPTFLSGAIERREEARARLGLDAGKPVVLLMGGGYGMMNEGMMKLAEEAAIGRAMQAVVVCGHNEKLRRKLAERLDRVAPGHDVHIAGFVSNMADYMAAADLIVTKPGGLTSSEAIAMRLPMVLYRPLPGQEEDNAEFLTQAGVAVRAEDDAELCRLVHRLVADGDTLARMRDKASRLHAETSTTEALEAIFAARHMPEPRWDRSALRVGV